MNFVLLFSVFVIATCGLVYELIAGALASYLLGDSVTQFSTVIGVYLFSMGIGSYLSKFVQKQLTTIFIRVEILVGLVGGCSAAALFLLFDQVASFRLVLYSLVVIVGTLVGLEIPLLMRILKGQYEFKDLVSKVFTFDYIGALLASLIFPLVLVPHLGLVRSAFLFGIFNVLVALWTLRFFRHEVVQPKLLSFSGLIVLAVLLSGFVYSDKILSFAETFAYPGKILYADSSPYQRIILTQAGDSLSLFLNGNLQFNSRDEYRYHEALVHFPMAAISNPHKILVLGGGDGLAVREILKYPSVESVTLVELDPEMTRLFSTNPRLTKLNDHSFQSLKVKIVNRDAFPWLRENQERFDAIIVDFPDPSNFSIGKLYSDRFFAELYRSLEDSGVVVIQSTSPFVAKKSFWCVVATLEAVGFRTTPYHVYVPSFGEWGYVMASKRELKMPTQFLAGLKFIDAGQVSGMLYFPSDMKVEKSEVNKLNNQILVRYFEEEWSRVGQ